jgi:hypothetical protein
MKLDAFNIDRKTKADYWRLLLSRGRSRERKEGSRMIYAYRRAYNGNSEPGPDFD